MSRLEKLRQEAGTYAHSLMMQAINAKDPVEKAKLQAEADLLYKQRANALETVLVPEEERIPGKMYLCRCGHEHVHDPRTWQEKQNAIISEISKQIADDIDAEILKELLKAAETTANSEKKNAKVRSQKKQVQHGPRVSGRRSVPWNSR